MFAPIEVSALVALVCTDGLLTYTYARAFPSVVTHLIRFDRCEVNDIHEKQMPSVGSYSPGHRTGPVGAPTNSGTTIGCRRRNSRSAGVRFRGSTGPSPSTGAASRYSVCPWAATARPARAINATTT